MSFRLMSSAVSARANARDYDTKTVAPSAVDEHLAAGWEISKRNSKSVRLRRSKPHGNWLEDRVWTLLYRMKFAYLSGARGAQLRINSADGSPETQLDVVAIDSEVGIAIECICLSRLRDALNSNRKWASFLFARDRFTASARKDFQPAAKRLIVLAMFTSNIILSDNTGYGQKRPISCSWMSRISPTMRRS